MDNKKRKKYDRIAKITGILVGLILVLGTSYAVFRTVTRGEQENVISAGKLDVRIENEQDEINLENAFPITEEEGKKQTPYTFDIVNEGTINAEYDLYIEIDESVSTLPTEVVRYYLTVEEDGTEKIVTSASRILSQEEMIEKEGKKLYKLDNKYLDTEKTNHYKLYLWVDYDATTEQAINKTFEAKVSIEATQIYDKNKLIQQIDVSANGDGSAIAYMYADGSVVIKGQGEIKENLSDTLVYANEKMLSYMKQVFIFSGCPKEEVDQLETMQDMEAYMGKISTENPDIMETLENNAQVVLMIDALNELGYNTTSITNMDTLMTYLVEQGIMDAEGQWTEKGQEVQIKLEEINNSVSNPTIPPKNIVIEEGITNIPNGLYTGNEDIKKVVIPASVKTIGNKAFYGCTGLTDVTIPNSVTSIGDHAFYNCTALTKVSIPNSVTSIGTYGFCNCLNLQNINIPSKITTIGDYTFNNCSELSSIEIPENVTNIGRSAFYGCTGLTTIEIPESVTYIGSVAFQCENLTTLRIYTTTISSLTAQPFSSHLETVEILGKGKLENSKEMNYPWYYSKTNIKKVILSDQITSIGNYVFNGCIGLTTIEIPNSVTSIGNGAFQDCQKLSAIEIPDSVTSIGDSAFRNCTGLTTIEISENVTSIGDYAFRNCTGLTTIEISENVTNIGDFALSSCLGLQSISVNEDNQYYTSIDGILYNKSVTEIIQCPGAKIKISLPETVTKIGNNAFTGGNLTSIEIPASVTYIGEYSFQDTKLTSIEIPDHVTYVGYSAFADCTELNSLSIPGDTNARVHTFDNVSNIKTLIITGTGEMNDYIPQPSNYWDCKPWEQSSKSIEKVVIEEGVTGIGNYSFYYFTNLKTVEIASTVTSIGSYSFDGCSGLATLRIPSTVQSIGQGAFDYCTGLTELSIPGNINSNEFYYAHNLKTVEIVGNMKDYQVGNYEYTVWYQNKDSIETIIIADGVTHIGSNSFRDCTNVKKVEIPSSVQTIGEYAFSGWTSSQVINIDNTEAYVNENWGSNWNANCSAQINYLRT